MCGIRSIKALLTLDYPTTPSDPTFFFFSLHKINDTCELVKDLPTISRRWRENCKKKFPGCGPNPLPPHLRHCGATKTSSQIRGQTIILFFIGGHLVFCFSFRLDDIFEALRMFRFGKLKLTVQVIGICESAGCVVWDSFGTDKASSTPNPRMLCGPDSIIDAEETYKDGGVSRGVPRGLFRDLLYPTFKIKKKGTFLFYLFFFFFFCQIKKRSFLCIASVALLLCSGFRAFLFLAGLLSREEIWGPRVEEEYPCV